MIKANKHKIYTFFLDILYIDVIIPACSPLFFKLQPPILMGHSRVVYNLTRVLFVKTSCWSKPNFGTVNHRRLIFWKSGRKLMWAGGLDSYSLSTDGPDDEYLFQRQKGNSRHWFLSPQRCHAILSVDTHVGSTAGLFM